MNGVHDLGGMHGFGPVVRENNEPIFHADWEKRVFALALTAAGRRLFNADELRRAIEWMPPARYLSTTYYEKYLHALESLLLEKGVVTPEELTNGHAAAPAPAQETGSLARDDAVVKSFHSSAVKLRFDRSFKSRFRSGDRVVARNINPKHHTRLPRYARGKRGVVRYDQGVFVFPDTHAHGKGAKPQHVYTVAFDAKELWGPDSNYRASVYLDCWEDYLERDGAAAKTVSKLTSKSTAAVAKPSKRPNKSAAKRPTRKLAAKGRILPKPVKKSSSGSIPAGKGRKR